MSSPVRILVVAHRTAATPKLLEQVRVRAEQGSCCAAPVLGSRDRRGGEGDRAGRVIAGGGGSDRVEAVVGDTDPFIAVQAALERSRFDEVIVSALPGRVSHWLRLDLPARVERLGGPPRHSLAGADRRCLLRDR
jgi:hypothetical protein